MSVQDILRRAKDALSNRKTVVQNRYTDLVRGLAEGEDIEPNGVLDILSSAEKTEDDLQHDVDAFGTRDELARLKTEQAELIDRKRELVDELGELQEQIEDIKVTEQTSKDELRKVSGTIHRIRNRRLELLRNFPEAAPEYGNMKERFRHYAESVNSLLRRKAEMPNRIDHLKSLLSELENSKFYSAQSPGKKQMEEQTNRRNSLQRELEDTEVENGLLAEQIDEFTMLRNEANKEIHAF